jgi:hypothetical protein
MVFTGEEFMTLATFAMCNDKPENTDCIDVLQLHSILDQIACSMGFDDWTQAYHQLDV